MYKSPLGDLAMREEVLRKYLPQVPFVDHSPQQLPVDDEAEITDEELRRGLPVKPRSASESEAATAMVEEVLHDVMEQLLVVA